MNIRQFTSKCLQHSITRKEKKTNLYNLQKAHLAQTHTKKNTEFFSVSLANCFYSDLFEIRKSAATTTAATAAAKRNYPFKIIALQCPNAVKKEMKYDRKPKATEREQESAIFSQSRNENRREKKNNAKSRRKG